jgi:natural product biosynthesis luciferase-like monooxygenase protein
MDFSLLYFANHEPSPGEGQYDLLLAGARFADDHDFTAVWVPERHFHPFGGAYPNPALAAAALATATGRVRIRAGSVVLPLHDPVRVVEDWAMVDNLSHGRVDLSLAAGWNSDDFVLAPERYPDRRSYVRDTIPLLRDLWAGRPTVRRNGDGNEVEVRTYPPPVQPDLNLWLTATASRRTFAAAGALGLNVLTALLVQSVDDLAAKIGAYREARAEAGLDPDTGVVTVMVHSFVGETDRAVREAVRPAFIRYLESSIELWRDQWPAIGSAPPHRLAAYAFERYFQAAALFGSVPTCVAFAERLRGIGVGEIACLVDFGVPAAATIAALPFLDEVRQRVQARTPVPSPAG